MSIGPNVLPDSGEVVSIGIRVSLSWIGPGQPLCTRAHARTHGGAGSPDAD